MMVNVLVDSFHIVSFWRHRVTKNILSFQYLLSPPGGLIPGDLPERNHGPFFSWRIGRTGDVLLKPLR
jgi:hypothetical protein